MMPQVMVQWRYLTGDGMRVPIHDATGVSDNSLDSLVVLRGWGMRQDREKRVAVQPMSTQQTA